MFPFSVELKLVMSCMLKLFSGSVVCRNRPSSQLEYLFGHSVLNRTVRTNAWRSQSWNGLLRLDFFLCFNVSHPSVLFMR